MKKIIKQILPPIIFDFLKRTVTKDDQYGFFGNYKTWHEARKDSVGYDSEIILIKVRDALLKVKNDEAVYERDSVLFDRIYYSFPLLAGLLKVALKNSGKLSVLDFGGSLGSTFFQCQNFLSDLTELTWSIIEQDQFVTTGREYFQTHQLKFYYSFDECLAVEKPNVIVLSGVIQCLENPYIFIEEVISHKFDYIIVDITAFFKYSTSDRLTIQKVPPSIYPASYPAWIFDEQKFLSCFAAKYKLLAEFDSLKSQDLERLSANLRGFIFERIN